jgi:hypothetical protein
MYDRNDWSSISTKNNRVGKPNKHKLRISPKKWKNYFPYTDEIIIKRQGSLDS